MIGISKTNGLGLSELHFLPFKDRLARMAVNQLYHFIVALEQSESEFIEGFDYAIDAFNEQIVHDPGAIKKMMGFAEAINPMEAITLCAHVVLLDHNPRMNSGVPFRKHIKRLARRNNIAELKAAARAIHMDEDTFLRKGMVYDQRPSDHALELEVTLVTAVFNTSLSDTLPVHAELMVARTHADTMMTQQGYIMRQLEYDLFNQDRLLAELHATTAALRSTERHVGKLESRIDLRD